MSKQGTWSSSTPLSGSMLIGGRLTADSSGGPYKSKVARTPSSGENDLRGQAYDHGGGPGPFQGTASSQTLMSVSMITWDP